MERYFFNTDIAVADKTDDSPGTLSGYAMKFGILSHDRGGYRDTFRQGVFGDSLNGSEGFDVRAYLNHDNAIMLGRARNNTLSLGADDTGLRFSLQLPNTTAGRDTAALVGRGDISGMSFGYIPEVYEWRDNYGDIIREHISGTLFEVSVVYDPGFPSTEVVLSSLGEPDANVLNELEEWKQSSAGTPRRQAAKRVLKILDLTA